MSLYAEFMTMVLITRILILTQMNSLQFGDSGNSCTKLSIAISSILLNSFQIVLHQSACVLLQSTDTPADKLTL